MTILDTVLFQWQKQNKKKIKHIGCYHQHIQARISLIRTKLL